VIGKGHGDFLLLRRGRTRLYRVRKNDQWLLHSKIIEQLCSSFFSGKRTGFIVEYRGPDLNPRGLLIVFRSSPIQEVRMMLDLHGYGKDCANRKSEVANRGVFDFEMFSSCQIR